MKEFLKENIYPLLILPLTILFGLWFISMYKEMDAKARQEELDKQELIEYCVESSREHHTSPEWCFNMFKPNL